MKRLTSIFLILFSSVIFAQNNTDKPDYVGYQNCTSCHDKEVNEWQSSHHKQAMQHVTEDTVLGNFNQVRFENYGLTTTFFKKEGKFWVNTDGPDGKLHDYPIKYTFGVYPLQQYLVEFPGGRLQALDIAWDSRLSSLGGQRWYHLHPDEKIDSNDVLHWTGSNLNWNYMCAFCHSTNLEKNYQSDSDTYQTSWSEINVSCEACHGPASQHLQWAVLNGKDNKQVTNPYNNKGLVNSLKKPKQSQWQIDKNTKKPFYSGSKNNHHEIETCARCHSRRSQLGSDSIHTSLMESFRPARLIHGLYYADGQPKDEVYVYGSFIQSKMYHSGVTCSDCHNTHSLALKLPGDQVCNQCHISQTYRSESHHHHKVKSDKTDISCIDCHMPATTYMGVDERHDHSFRIPRPDLSIGTGIPNACNKCHTVNTAQWSEQRLKDWYKKRPVGLQQFAPAFNAHQQQLPIAEKKLHDLINDKNQPAIARATALGEQVHYPGQASFQLIKKQLNDAEPMIRLAALEALSSFDKRSQLSLALPLIYDDIRSIRMEAAQLLASVPQGQLPDKDKKQLELAQQEYLKSQQFNAERPESHTNLGNYYYKLKDLKKSEAAYQYAIKLQNQFVPAYVGLAQLFSQTGREEKASYMLKLGLVNIPKNADLHHALGLSYIRQKKTELALVELQLAADNAVDNIRYQYVYAVALNTLGATEKALKVLRDVHTNHPGNTEILIALITMNRDIGHYQEALAYAQKLNQIAPGNKDVNNIIHELYILNSK